MPARLRIPHEAEVHQACWMAWPFRSAEWLNLERAQREFILLLTTVSETEHVNLLVPDTEFSLPLQNLTTHVISYGDSWTRDTLPIFACAEENTLKSLVFDFDGWGGKYQIPGDKDLGKRVAALAKCEYQHYDIVLEGGSVEFDGAGTMLTTRNCLEKRNPSKPMESLLQEAFSVERVLWLEGQLQNDHTDGHIDTLARFVEPGRVLCATPSLGDPNEAMLRDIERQLRTMGLQVELIPSPGSIESASGELLPASYCNYYLSNERVLVPQYNVPADKDALDALGHLFPLRKVIGLPAQEIIEGGGAFHCITQQQPACRNFV